MMGCTPGRKLEFRVCVNVKDRANSWMTFFLQVPKIPPYTLSKMCRFDKIS